MDGDTTISPEEAFQYIGELLSEYMKTLPTPVRQPVVQYVNHCTAILANELSDTHKLRKELEMIKSGEGDE